MRALRPLFFHLDSSPHRGWGSKVAGILAPIIVFLAAGATPAFAGDCPECKPIREVCLDVFVVGFPDQGVIRVGAYDQDRYKQPDALRPGDFTQGLIDLLKSPKTPTSRFQVQDMAAMINKVWETCCVRFRLRRAIGVDPSVFPGMTNSE